MPSPPFRHQHSRVIAAALAAAAVALSACGSRAPTTAMIPKTIRVANVAQAAVDPVTVSPLPGTPDASPRTQISFLGGPGTTVSDVHVVGSRSGRHGGRLEAYSSATGESFIPNRQFRSGARVLVSA